VDVAALVERVVIVFVLLSAVVLVAASGVPGLFLDRASPRGQQISVWMMGIGCTAGIGAAFGTFFLEHPPELRAPWPVPGGELHFAVDGISALFLIQIFLVSLMGSIYGLSYWKQVEHRANGRKLSCFYGLLTAGLALLIISRNTLLFLAGWELMALSAFIVLSTEDDDPSVAESSFIYLCATRTGTLALLAFFAALFALTGKLELTSPASSASGPLATAAFLLGLLGFGLKAGIMPLHLWLPSAHANAPSHVSALMSGVLIKMGVYGLVRTCSLFPAPPLWWGELLLCLGAVSGVLGVAFAIGQHDIKRLLAYHSVENIGIISIGLGLATMGRSLGRHDLIIAGIAGALLHVLNHGLFKALLFLSAGSVVHATKTREIDHLGGLIRTMPRTAAAFLIGAVAICGLPPLNGFVSELLIYVGLLRSFTTLSFGEGALAVAFAAPALALIGALAVACFVKVFGAVFLGVSRSSHTDHAHDADGRMAVPMLILALSCASIGLLPALLSPLLAGAAVAFAPETRTTVAALHAIVPLPMISFTSGFLLCIILLIWRWLAARIDARPVASAGTWDCGYAAPGRTMQYTASSFAEMLVRLFSFALRPRIHRPVLEGPFPQRQRLETRVPEPILESIVLPVSTGLARVFNWFRWMQSGSVHAYLLYVLLTLLALLLLR
jgi:hydrogenase-4 component B